MPRTEPLRQSVESSADHPFMTVAEAATQLGYSHMTIRRRIEAGQFPAIKMGSKAVVPRQFVEALVAAAVGGRTIDVDDFAVEWSARYSEGVAS